MPILAPRPSKSSQGFTLIEIMLVLVVVAIMVSLLTVSMGGNPMKELDREARRLRHIIELASDEAVMQGQEFALALPADGYQLIAFDVEAEQWRQLPGKMFQRYRTPEAISLEFELDGRQLTEQERQSMAQLQKRQGEQDLQPALLLLSSGETSPFAISLHHSEVSTAVQLSSDGFSGVSSRDLP